MIYGLWSFIYFINPHASLIHKAFISVQLRSLCLDFVVPFKSSISSLLSGYIL